MFLKEDKGKSFQFLEMSSFEFKDEIFKNL